MANDKNYKTYYYTGEDTTVEEFLEGDILDGSVSKTVFLNFSVEGISNLKLIWSKYNKLTEQPVYKSQYSGKNLSLLKKGTNLYLPLSAYQEQSLILKGKNLFLSQKDGLLPYFSFRKLELEGDPTYVKKEVVTKEGRDINVQIIEENCQVWVYSKALDKIMNLSPFIQSLSTNKGEIGSFSFTLLPTQIELDESSNENLVSDYDLLINGKLNISFFEKYFQQNDVCFLRFEKLDIEINSEYETDLRGFVEINKSELPDQIFDMIGLIDSVSSSNNFERTDTFLSIKGRDLTKVLLEDGSYNMPLIYQQGNQNRFFYGGSFEDKYFKRNYVDDGAFSYMYKQEAKGIEDYLGFVVNQLSNVGWTKNELFSAYGDKRTQAYKIQTVSGTEDYITENEVNGVWQIIKLSVDPQLTSRRIANETMMDEESTLIEQFKNVCQDPFVHVWGDTYGSQFEFIVRQQPFDKKGMRQIVKDKYYTELKNEDVYEINLEWETEYYSWYKLMPTSKQWASDKSFLDLAFPIVYLEKYVQNFGNHKRIIPDNYIPVTAFTGSKSKEDTNVTAEALFNDLKYILESESVLPFTRRGTLVINGDRRIKRGDFVKLNATNEICYVESVNNTVSFSGVSVNRTTVLSVRRCMIEKFIVGAATGEGKEHITESKLEEDEIRFIALQKAQGIRFIGEAGVIPERKSYYDIVNAEVITKDLLNSFFSTEGGKDLKFSKSDKNINANFTVSDVNFDFFLKRQQFNS